MIWTPQSEWSGLHCNIFEYVASVVKAREKTGPPKELFKVGSDGLNNGLDVRRVDEVAVTPQLEALQRVVRNRGLEDPAEDRGRHWSNRQLRPPWSSPEVRGRRTVGDQ